MSTYKESIKRHTQRADATIPNGYKKVLEGKIQVGDLCFNMIKGEFELMHDQSDDIGTRVKGFIRVVRK